MQIHNVDDRHRQWVGSWEAEPLDYDRLSPQDIGRKVIYRDHGRAELGVVSSWRNKVVFARYSLGDTAAGADHNQLVFAIRPLDGPGAEQQED